MSETEEDKVNSATDCIFGSGRNNSKEAMKPNQFIRRRLFLRV